MKRPLYVTVGLIFGLIIAGLATVQSAILLLSIPLLVYLFSAIYNRPDEILLDIRRQITPDHAPQGTPIEVKVVITNRGSAIDELVIQEFLPEGIQKTEGRSSVVTRLAPQASASLEYTVQALRGEYDTYDVAVETGDFCGFFRSQVIFRTDPHLVIQPRYPKLDRIKVRPPQTRGFAGPISARQGGTGIDFFGVREYQAGDPQRHINWRIAARREQSLFTNIFEQERVADVGLILDARQRLNVSSPTTSLFEHSVHAAAALAENFLSDGNRVSLLIYGSGLESVFPGYGKIQKDRILKALARAKPGMNYALENLSYLPTRFFPAKSQIVLISPLSPEDIPIILQVRAHGYAVMVVSPDPISFASALDQDFSSLAYRLAAAERELMLQQVRRGGMPVVNWRVDQPLEVVVRDTLTRQPVFHYLNRIGV